MSTNAFLVFNLILLAIVLESDLGRRRIGLFRLVRPLVGAVAVTPFFIAAPQTSGWSLGLEVAGAAVGIALGLAAAALLPVRWDAGTGRAYSYAGVAYGLLWLAVSAARSRYAFAYGAHHLFTAPSRAFVAGNQVSAAGLTDALIVAFLAMYLTRAGSLLWRRYSVRRAAEA